MIRFLDEKFRNNKKRYIAQAILGGLAVGVALTFFDVVRQPVIIASLGASCFIAFTMPHRGDSSPRYLIGSYFIGIIVGCLIHCATVLPIDHYLTQKILHVIAGGTAVALAMFLMTITNTEHAPATSIALGLVINDWTFQTVALVMLGIVLISGIQRVLKPWMMDLL